MLAVIGSLSSYQVGSATEGNKGPEMSILLIQKAVLLIQHAILCMEIAKPCIRSPKAYIIHGSISISIEVVKKPAFKTP